MNNVNRNLSKLVTPQILSQYRKQAVRNMNVIKLRMYRLDTRPTQTKAPQLPQSSRNTNPRMSNSTGLIHRTIVSRPQFRSTQMKEKVMQNNSRVKINQKEVEDHYRISSFSNKTKSITACHESFKSRTLNVNVVCVTCVKCVFNSNHNACVSNFTNEVNARTKKPQGVPISTRGPKRKANQTVAPPIRKQLLQNPLSRNPGVTLGCFEKTNRTNHPIHRRLWMHKAHDRKSQVAIYGDLVQGNITIKRVYYVEGLNHNLFSVGQLCDVDLKVAFQKSTCFVRDLQGNDLLTGNHGSDLYTITRQKISSPTPICFMAKATPTQAWLWHRKLYHLNFDTINLLSKKDIMNSLPNLKYVKDHLCSSCELGKANRSTFKTKTVPSSKGRLNSLHMDLCGPMRIKSINGKKYILVIVDDYSRYTWTHFLRSKD
ncbi:retrovirus-related pol polyprotein from transposon TNT 1-94 [Tanacetum coccineum]